MSFLRRRGAAGAPLSPQAPGEDVDEAAEPDAEPVAEPVAEPGAAQAAGAAGADPAPDRRHGPWDVEEVAGADDAAAVPRVDLGALQVPTTPGMELRLEVEEATSRVVAATVVLGESAAQLQVFAAPRTEGIWRAVRREIATSVTGQGGTADEVTGEFGTQLLARVPARTPEGRTTHQLARFVGVDGPRWFLRAVLSGPAAGDEGAAHDLMDVLRGTVVVRGSEAMPPRDLLDLRLPAADELDAAGGEATGGPDGPAGAQGGEVHPLAPPFAP